MSSTTTPRPSTDSYFPPPSNSSYSTQAPDLSSYKWANQRRGSTASSVQSLVSVPESRSTRDIGKNAIANLVENPASKVVLPRPTTRDIPPVTLTNIPKVELSEFSSYLSIAPDFERYLRGKEEDLDLIQRQPQTQSTDITPNVSVTDLDVFRRASTLTLTPDDVRRPSSAWSDISATSPSRPTFDTGSRRGSARKHSLAFTPLSTVPRVYFEDNFHLENPRTFDVVSERSHVIQTPIAENPNGNDVPALAGRKALATNAILQEKLSWYMDTVEVHLIREISSASTGFFAALGSLRDLHAEAEASVQKIQSLREELTHLDKEQAIAGLDIVRLRRRRENVDKLVKTIDQVALVLNKLAQIQSDLDNNDLRSSIQTIEETEAIMAGHSIYGPSKPFVDLQDLRALDAVQLDIAALRKRVGKAYESSFVETLINDLREHAKEVEPSDTLFRFYQAYMRQQNRSLRLDAPPTPRIVTQTYAQLPDTLQATLLVQLDGLKRAQQVEASVQAYREAVMRETKNIIRRNMPSDDDAESTMSGRSSATGVARTTAEKSSSLARSLRNLGPREAEDMLVRVYTNVSEVLRRLGAQQKLLLDITSGMNSVLSPRNSIAMTNGVLPPPAAKSFADTFSVFYSMDISELISVSVDTAQQQVIKVLKVRSEQISHLPLGDFLRFFMLNRVFSSECEALSGKVFTGLQTVIGGQIKEFIQAFHQDNMKELAGVIEKDRWEAKDFDNVEKERLDRILEAATKDADSWSQWMKIYEDPPLPPVKEERPVEEGTPTAKLKTATIDNQKYILPESGIAILRCLESYECLFTIIPSSTADVATNILDFLKLFNSRVCQVILGAGATKSAGLKHITTKHLALASQALSIVIAVIPYTRECVRRHLGSAASGGTLIPGFDAVKRNYQEHQAEIHSKLISIMSDRLMAHVRNIRTNVNWDDDRKEEKEKPNMYMETLVKETSTLHKVLSKHLPEEILLSIMQPVFVVYRRRLIEAYEAVTITTNIGRIRLIRDAQYFRDRMSKLDGCDTAGDDVLAVAKAKKIGGPSNAVPSTVSSTALSSSTSTTVPTIMGATFTDANGEMTKKELDDKDDPPPPTPPAKDIAFTDTGASNKELKKITEVVTEDNQDANVEDVVSAVTNGDGKTDTKL